MEIHSQQIAHRVFVFEVGEASGNCDVAFFPTLLGGISDALIDPCGDCMTIFFLWLRFVIGRHVAILEHDQDVLPGLHLLVTASHSSQLVERQLALGLVGPVASEAVFFQERPDRLLEAGLTSRYLRGRRADHCHPQGECREAPARSDAGNNRDGHRDGPNA